MLLSYDPSDTQELACEKWIDKTTEEILFGGNKGGGKSNLGATLIFGDALTYPETRYFIARETLKDLTLYTTPTINEIFSEIWKIDITQYAKFNGQYNNYKCYNGSIVQFLECSFLPSDPLYERFGSMQWTRGWIEEGGEVSDLAYRNLKLGIGRWKNDKYDLKKKLLITSNPKKNWMKYGFVDLAKAGTLPPEKAYISSSVYDNKHRQKGYEKVLEEMTGTMRQRLLLGLWDYDSDDDCLIAGEKILGVYTNQVQRGADKYISCDVGRFGKDKSTIWVWEGWVVIQVVILEKKNTKEVAEQILRLCSLHLVPLSNVVIDDDGVGGGTVDNIPGCVRFVNNSSPLPNIKDPTRKENFDNLKSQVCFLIAEMINKGLILIDFDLSSIFGQDGKSIKQLLNEEMEQVRQKAVDDDKKKGVMPKDKVKEILGRSPDYWDGFMMRGIFDLTYQYTWGAL